jgi:hypothetical protein
LPWKRKNGRILGVAMEKIGEFWKCYHGKEKWANFEIVVMETQKWANLENFVIENEKKMSVFVLLNYIYRCQ